MIEYRNVTKIYSTGVAAVNNTSLEIEKGEFVFIVGGSGCGKSTLMKMLMKEVEPTEGQILVNGIDITRISKRRIPHRRSWKSKQRFLC